MLVLAVSAVGLIPKSAYAAPGDLFVSVNGTGGNGGGSIIQYAPDGTHNTFVPNPNSPLGLDRPRGLAFDNTLPPTGPNLFVATNPRNNGNIQGTILKFTPDGGTRTTFASGFDSFVPGANFFLQGLVTDSAGNVFVAAGDNNDSNFATTIFKVTPAGQ